MLHCVMQGDEKKKLNDLFTLYKQLANINEENTSSKKLESENGVMATDMSRPEGPNVMDYHDILIRYQQQQAQQLDAKQQVLLLQHRNIFQQQFQEHLRLQLQKQNEHLSNEKIHRPFAEHHHRNELAQAVLNKDKSNKSANASNAVKQHLQKFVIERQKGKQLDNMIDRNQPYGWNPGLNANGLHEISAPYPNFFDKRSSFPLRKTASEPNLKVPSKMKQKVTHDRRNSPLVMKNSAEVRSELANKLKRKLNSVEQDAVNSAPSSGSSSPLNNSHNDNNKMSTNSIEVDQGEYTFPVRLMGHMASGRDLYTSPSLPNLSLGISKNGPENRLPSSGMVMYADADLQRLAVTRTASLPAPFMQAGLPGFPFAGFPETLAMKVMQQQQMLVAEMSANAEQPPGPIRHTPVSRPHKVLSRTHSAPTSSAQMQMQYQRRRLGQPKLMQQQHKQHISHLPGLSSNEYFQRLPTHKESTTESAKPRSRVHLAASPPPTHPSAISHTTAAALASHLRHTKMHGSFPHLASKPKRPSSPTDVMDHSPVQATRSVIVSAPSSSTDLQRRISDEYEPDKEKLRSESNSSLSTLSPILAQKKLAAMAVNDDVKHVRRSMLAGDMSLHRPLTRTQSSPAVSFTQKPPMKKYDFTTCLAYDPIMLKHGCACGDPHAEHAGRVKEVWNRLCEKGLVAQCESIEPRKATMEELQLAHTYEHTLRYGASPLARQQTVMSDKFIVLPCGGLGVNNSIDIDTVWNEQDTINAARMAVGLTVDLSLMVAEGHLKNGFAVVRPPGHHAEKKLAMAFCYFNAVAVAARKLQTTLPDKMRRILIVDWDAHHCNGTQDIFYDDPSVLVVSIHRYDEGNFFPGTGAPEETGDGPGVGFNVNIGFSGGVDPQIGDAEYLSAFRSIVLPIAEEFKPDFVFVSAGFSASAGHPATLGGYHVTPQCFSYLTRILSKLAGGKLVMALEGGFELSPLCDCVEACVRTLLTDPLKDDDFSMLPKASSESVPCETSNRSLNRIGRIQERYWSGIKRSSSFLKISHLSYLRELQDDNTVSAMASLSVDHGSSLPQNITEGKTMHTSSNVYSVQGSKHHDDDGESKLIIVTDESEQRDFDGMSATSSPVDVVGISSPSPAPSMSPVPSPIHAGARDISKSPVIMNPSTSANRVSTQMEEEMEQDPTFVNKENS